ncbi:MAG TPA: zf-HC2 domain-containing protein [Bacteroidota bacterium]|nr:zf-HC2 domain-containing protein [Bacteroidota bacterium]
MDCQEFRELISDAVDERLGPGYRRTFADHAGSCRNCRNEFELERITKQVIRTRVRPATAPAEVYESLRSTIRRSPSNSQGWLGIIFGGEFLNPAVALVALLVIVVGAISLLQKNNAIPLSTEKNIIAQSINNYTATMAGILKPELVSHDPDDIKDYLSKDTPFDVSVVTLDGCDWCGGVLSNVNGVRLVHVVYKIGGEGILYVYQVNLQEAMRGERVGLPEHAKSVLAKTGWYCEQTPEGCNVVLWRHKNTLCAAVSKIEKGKMIALLSDKKP